MQAVTPNQIDSIFTMMQEYEKANFGLKNGSEFPAVAQALLASEKFKHQLQVAAMLGMLSVLTMPKEEGAMKTKEAQDKMLSDSPLRGILADVFYAGFQLGRASAEVGQLEALAQQTA